MLLDNAKSQEQAQRCVGLWAAVLSGAIADWADWVKKGQPGVSRKNTSMAAPGEGAKAQRWLFEAKHRGVGSFPWVCDVCGLDPEAVRERLLKKQREMQAVRAARLAASVD